MILHNYTGDYHYHLHSTATKELVDKYEKQCQDFMASKTVNQFKALFPASATPSKLVAGKVLVELWFLNVWGDNTLNDLKNLVGIFGVPGKHLHLSKIEDSCISVTWLCSTSFITELKAAIVKATDLLLTMGVLKVFIEKELILECSQGTATVYTTLLLLLHVHVYYAQQSYMFGRVAICTFVLHCVGVSKVPTRMYISYTRDWAVRRQPSHTPRVVRRQLNHTQTTPNSIHKTKRNY